MIDVNRIGDSLAVLRQVGGPMLVELDSLPEPQQQALRVAFGCCIDDSWPTLAPGS